ncbi:hypothetical protein [Novacetimonas hansenii]|uniref:Uncharacterized protein n=1 Tax=Novacetimonas hansenii TaxID=436 RepID=A0ABQ0SGS9_NOVHA|nr:hypothetical protein [Novacetimonas hansenii]GAN84026.1 hypothetical protein Gaha_0122_026 [Novacetimonas hansenii JCM 7643]GBQ55801.1 hypothetical protein AA0243_1014 [Novacetimonas hansenii NRIC 0243]GEC64606.1 hypothetical protein GHA01_24550 [Novacetimonas hansenii]
MALKFSAQETAAMKRHQIKLTNLLTQTIQAIQKFNAELDSMNDTFKAVKDRLEDEFEGKTLAWQDGEDRARISDWLDELQAISISKIKEPEGMAKLASLKALNLEP